MKSKNQKGQGLVEYVLILILVALVVIVIMSTLSPVVKNLMTDASKLITPVSGWTQEPVYTLTPESSKKSDK